MSFTFFHNCTLSEGGREGGKEGGKEGGREGGGGGVGSTYE